MRSSPSLSTFLLAALALPLAAGAALPVDLDDELAAVDSLAWSAGGWIVYDQDPACRHLAPEHLADPAGLVDGWPRRTLDVAVVVDTEFQARHGAVWQAAATRIMGNVGAVYAADLQLDVRVVDVHAHGGDVFQDRTHEGTLVDMRAHYLAEHADIERDVVHLLTGFDIPGAMGKAYCIGAAGVDEKAYSWGEAYHGAFADRIVAAHEIGHVLSAHHHYATCGEGGLEGPGVRACTIMTPVIDASVGGFSTMNRLVMRGLADEMDI